MPSVHRMKIGAVFGSCGWSGESVGIIQQILGEMKFDLPSGGFEIPGGPDVDGNAECYDWSRAIGGTARP